MKNKYLVLYIAIFGLSQAYGQARFLQAGKIEFERKINVHRQIEGSDNVEWYKEYVLKMPRFHTTYFDLHFAEGKTMYKPGRSSPDATKQNNWMVGPSKENYVLADLKNQVVSSQKNVFEETYILLDSGKHLEWKMSDEVRNIAGFDCRKAVARICDSVYVVAFYTDEILVSGGPESFNGLPGMILGLAIPRLYTTWFATKVELITPGEKEFTLPRKGKKITEPELTSILKRSMTDWGAEGQKNIWWVML